MIKLDTVELEIIINHSICNVNFLNKKTNYVPYKIKVENLCMWFKFTIQLKLILNQTLMFTNKGKVI